MDWVCKTEIYTWSLTEGPPLHFCLEPGVYKQNGEAFSNVCKAHSQRPKTCHHWINVIHLTFKFKLETIQMKKEIKNMFQHENRTQMD